MTSMTTSEMAQIEGGEFSTSCGVMVGATVASFFYFPFVTASLAEVTVAVCATT
jgi:bacteriocin-like protein